MYNDGIMSDWELEKLCRQFYPNYLKCYGFDKNLWDSLTKLIVEDVKERAKSEQTKSTTKKSTTPKTTKPVEQSTKSKNVDVDDDLDWEISDKLIQKLLNALTGVNDAPPKGKHEKSTPPKTPPEVKKYMDDKTKVSLTDKPKTESTGKGKKRMQTITIVLTNGKTATWTNDNYDDYKLTDTCFIIKKNGEYVGIYNMRYVTSIVVK